MGCEICKRSTTRTAKMGDSDSWGGAMRPGTASFSPYLSVDPKIFRQSEPQYIFPEGASPRRGRFELAFSQIGGSVMLGGFFGGGNGLISGLRDKQLTSAVWTVRRTQLLNYVSKQGAASAASLGVMAVMYSGFGVILSWLRGADDELNTMAAATATGLLYKSSAGMKKCLLGGGVGLGIAAAYCLYTSKDRLKQMAGR